ncbi:MAG: hypothetical protein HY692_09270, partial [Cyanobacteria bacterium NC_groundwater_1444_Ag_S-0.65um_54_12]|nr:hypothetical protein [Cyanobacteria bacterium NC_groundwater_1444_Ag_S-0.65um_54_12]
MVIRRTITWRSVVIFPLAVVFVASCQERPWLRSLLSHPDTALSGQVTFRIEPASAYHTAATLGEVANAATVSLIDADTGNTVASSVTDASGSFLLTF